MIIVVNGGYRTGSTLIYSIVYALLEFNKIPFEHKVLWHQKIIRFSRWLKRKPTRKVYLVKSHNFLSFPITEIPENIKTIYSQRFFLDSMVSLNQLTPALDPITEILEEKRRKHIMLNFHDRVLNLHYEDFFDHIEYAAKRICTFLYLLKLKIPPNFETYLSDYMIKRIKFNSSLGRKRHKSKTPFPGKFIEFLSFEEIKNFVSKYNADFYS